VSNAQAAPQHGQLHASKAERVPLLLLLAVDARGVDFLYPNLEIISLSLCALYVSGLFRLQAASSRSRRLFLFLCRSLQSEISPESLAGVLGEISELL
jgi:hypothetical protein